MTEPHDLERLETMFQAVVDLDEGERAAYLDRECSDDTVLRATVERMLSGHDRGDSMTMPVDAALGPFSMIAEGPGAIIGRYKLLQEIGEGGFGVVYMAEQQSPVVRKVALKIIKLGMDTREVVARFEAERQALAMMDHPNIARVLDGGATISGRPFFVMELVRGVSVTEYCDKNNLGTRERLELFVDICHAIQHAHQKGVIHRDLKPSNVLVTLHDGRPVCKVIDFGVAKAMHTRLTEKTLFTRYEQFIGTPAYMSPEQAELSALDVDTRTDIYSLGVLLYELLTGTTPFDFVKLREKGMVELQRVIREERPPRPSIRLSTRLSASGDAAIAQSRGADILSLSRRLRGDLDWIAMRALEKDRSRRYDSASEFAEDIRRHLRDEPVEAGPPGAGYRLRKFLARNRAAVLTATLVIIALVAGIVATALSTLEANRQEARARQQADRALATLEFFDATLALANPEIALERDLTVRALLDVTASRVQETFADEPLAEARVLTTIGRAYAALAEYEVAETHLRRVVELVEAVVAAQGPAALNTGTFDRGHYYAALWGLTNVCFELERADSFEIAQVARDISFEHLETQFPEARAALAEFVALLLQHAWSPDPDLLAGAPALCDAAMETARRAIPEGHEMWPIVADTFLTGGYTIWYTAHEPHAIQFWECALEIQQRELPPDHPDISTTVALLTGVLVEHGQTDRAESLIRTSLTALERVFDDGDYAVAQANSHLGRVLTAQGRYDDAEALLLRSHETIVGFVKSESNWRAVESILRILAMYDASHRPEAARPYRDSLAHTCANGRYPPQWAIARSAFGPEHGEVGAALDVLNGAVGEISFRMVPGTAGRGADVSVEVDRVIALTASQLAHDRARSLTVARLLLGWANALDPVEHAEARLRMAVESEAIIRAGDELTPLQTAEAIGIQVEALVDRGRPDEARRRAGEAWTLLRQDDVESHWFNVAIEARIARALRRGGMPGEAEAVLTRALKVLHAQLGPRNPDTNTVATELRDLYVARGRRADAQALEDAYALDPPTP